MSPIRFFDLNVSRHEDNRQTSLQAALSSRGVGLTPVLLKHSQGSDRVRQVSVYNFFTFLLTSL